MIFFCSYMSVWLGIIIIFFCRYISVWLGITYDTEEGHWKSLGTKSQLAYKSWGLGEPKTFECAAFNGTTRLWSAIDCNSKLKYVCEKFRGVPSPIPNIISLINSLKVSEIHRTLPAIPYETSDGYSGFSIQEFLASAVGYQDPR